MLLAEQAFAHGPVHQYHMLLTRAQRCDIWSIIARWPLVRNPAKALAVPVRPDLQATDLTATVHAASLAIRPQEVIDIRTETLDASAGMLSYPSGEFPTVGFQ